MLPTGRWYERLLAECLSTVVHVAPNERRSVACRAANRLAYGAEGEHTARDQLPAVRPERQRGGRVPAPSTVGKLFGLPTAQLCLRKLDEAALGQAMQMMQLATAVEMQLARQPVLGGFEQNEYI